MVALVPTLCRHCNTRRATRPHQLCNSCYFAPGVLALYPSTSKYAHRLSAIGTRGDALPEPTDAEPGSEAKILVLGERARLNQKLWHDDDAKMVKFRGYLGVHLHCRVHISSALLSDLRSEEVA